MCICMCVYIYVCVCIYMYVCLVSEVCVCVFLRSQYIAWVACLET